MKFGARLACAGMVAGAVAVPLGALASHGKVGLWEVTTHMNMGNMMANIPPEALARMREHGVTMPNNQSFTSQRCMTAADVASDEPPKMRNTDDCKMSNMSHDAHTFTADMVCSTERMNGRGHLSVNFDSSEHYAGTYAFNGTAEGHPQSMTYNFEARWISADCGSVK